MSLWLLEHHPRGKNSQKTVTSTIAKVVDRDVDRHMVYMYNAGTVTIEIFRTPTGVYGGGIPIAAGTDRTWTAWFGDDTESEFYAVVSSTSGDLRIEEAQEPD